MNTVLANLVRTTEIARQTTLLLLQNRLLWIVLVVELGVAVLGFCVGIDPPRQMFGRDLYPRLCWWLLGNVLLPWTAMYFGVQAVHGDIEDRTFQYLFLRPVPRSAILLGKSLAVAMVAAALSVSGALLLFLALLLHGNLWPDPVEWYLLQAFVQGFVLAALAYTAVAVFFAARLRRPLVWSACFIVGLQYFIANLPAKAGIRVLTVADPLRRFLFDSIEPDRRLARALWPAERDFQADHIGHPVQNLLCIAAVALVLALLSYTRSEYDSRERE